MSPWRNADFKSGRRNEQDVPVISCHTRELRKLSKTTADVSEGLQSQLEQDP